MNWGRPDWRNPEAYHPRSKRYDFRNPRILTEWFRWQFLRRRADYRADWRANITPESPVYKGEHPERHHEFSIGDVLYTRMEGSIEKYGSGTLFNPAHETPLDLFAVLPGLHRAYIIEGKINDKEYRPGQKYYLYAPMNLKGGIAWEFNLDQPISTQIDEARSELERAQKHKHGKLIPARKNASNPANREVVQFDNWRRFLRVLDASESGASDREILDVLWPGWRETGQKTFAHIASDRNAGEELKKSFPF